MPGKSISRVSRAASTVTPTTTATTGRECTTLPINKCVPSSSSSSSTKASETDWLTDRRKAHKKKRLELQTEIGSKRSDVQKIQKELTRLTDVQQGLGMLIPEINRLRTDLAYVEKVLQTKRNAERIQALHSQQQHSTMTLAEEKALLKEVGELRRPVALKVDLVREVRNKKELECDQESGNTATGTKVSRESTRPTQPTRPADKVEIIPAVDASVDEDFWTLTMKRNTLMAKLQIYQSSYQKACKDLNRNLEGEKIFGELLRKRKELREEIEQKVEAVKTLDEEFSKDVAKHRDLKLKKKEAEWNAEFHRIQEEKAQAKEEIIKRKALAFVLAPIQRRLHLVEQSITFTKALLPEEIKVTSSRPVLQSIPDDCEVLAPKADRDAVYLPTKKTHAKKAKTPERHFRHNALVLSVFNDLRVEVPMSIEDVPSALASLESARESCKAEIRRFEEDNHLAYCQYKNLSSASVTRA